MENVDILNYVNEEEDLISLKNAHGTIHFINMTLKENESPLGKGIHIQNFGEEKLSVKATNCTFENNYLELMLKVEAN